MTKPDPRRMAKRRTESDYVQQSVEHDYPLNTPVQIGNYRYYWRGYWRNPYGIVSYYAALAKDGTKLVKIGPTRAKNMRRVDES